MITERKWDRIFEPWLNPQDIPADPLGDLKTDGNSLSIWQIEDDKSNLEYILVGLIANRAKIDKLEYGLFNPQVPNNLGIYVDDKELGKLPIPEINGFHRNLTLLSADKLTELAKSIFPVISRERIYKEQAIEKILYAYNHGTLHSDRLNKAMKAEINKLLIPAT